MKRAMVIGLAVVIAVAIAGAVYAWWPGGYGYGMEYGTGTNVEAVKKFQKETLSLRDELTTKQLELQNEYNKPVPDPNRIATLRKEIIDIQAKIQTVADKHGLSTSGYMGGYMGRGMMMGPGMMGHGMTGYGTDAWGCPMWGW